LAEEFNAMAKAKVTGALLVDAGLNLNGRAFDQLEIAAERTGFFHNRKLICEVYPAKVTDQHIRFLSIVGNPLVGVGLQSFDNEVLTHVARSFDEQRFEDNMARLTNVSRVSPSSPTGRKIVGGENFLLYFWRRVFVSRLTAS
jgi:histone acetyltransferase (RNA polymerase elongator complex component)